MKKGFVFDLDGVITDTAKYHFFAWKSVAKKMGIVVDLDLNEKLKGISRMESLEVILRHGNKNNFSDEQKMKVANEKNTEYVNYLQNLTPNDILPGVKDFLDEARYMGIPCSIASASKNASFILDKLQISNYFLGIVDPDTLQKGKPDPEIFIKAASILNMKPEEVIGFEDSIAGIEGLKKAGIYAVGIENSESLLTADFRVSSFKDLNIAKLIRA